MQMLFSAVNFCTCSSLGFSFTSGSNQLLVKKHVHENQEEISGGRAAKAMETNTHQKQIRFLNLSKLKNNRITQVLENLLEMSQNFLQTGMTLAFLKLLSVRPQLKQGLKMSRVHIPTCKSMDTCLVGKQPKSSVKKTSE